MGKKTKFLMLGILALMIITPLFASAQLIPCGLSKDNPDTTTINETQPCTLCHLFDLAQTITNTLTTIIAPAIAVLAFSIGGFKILMSGPNPGYRAEGMKAIRNGVIGLIIVFGAWIIVNELLLFVVGGTGTAKVKSLTPWTQIQCIPAIEVTEEKPTTTTGATGGTAGRSCIKNGKTIYTLDANRVAGYTKSHTDGLAIIANKGVSINRSCNSISEAIPDGSSATCTSLAYLPDYALNKLIGLRNMINENIVITGGTECAHQTHGPDKAIVDLRYEGFPNLTTFIVSGFVGGTPISSVQYTPASTGGPVKTCAQYYHPGILTTFILENPECMGPGTATHWHIKL